MSCELPRNCGKKVKSGDFLYVLMSATEEKHTRSYFSKPKIDLR